MCEPDAHVSLAENAAAGVDVATTELDDAANNAVVDINVDIIPIPLFPPLPPIDKKSQAAESSNGIGFICCLSILFPGLAHAAFFVSNLPEGVSVAALITIWLCVIFAWVGACGMFFGDAGVIVRSEETCYPMPDKVASFSLSPPPIHVLF